MQVKSFLKLSQDVFAILVLKRDAGRMDCTTWYENTLKDTIEQQMRKFKLPKICEFRVVQRHHEN